jgi:pimeloyl-ACP methyl ester carboxylesterase
VSPGHDRYVETADGAKIHYCLIEPTAEQSPTFLFIHGLGSNWTRWKRLSEEPFFKSFRLMIPDLRGHGRSVARRGIDADGFAADLELILKKERVERPVVIGHCLGANIAVRFWERNPQNVRALVLIEPFVTEDLQPAWRILHAVLSPIVGLFAWMARGLNGLGLRRAQYRFIDYSTYDDWVRTRLTNFFNVVRFMGPWLDLQCMPMASYIASFRVLFSYRPPWRTIEVPTLALIARQGGVMSPEPGPGPFKQAGVQTVGIEASHFVLTDNRKGVVQQIQSFVEGLNKG